MLLLFAEWCEATWLGTAVRDSIWAFPVIEAVHLLGLALLGGALLVVDLRLLGTGLTNQSASRLSRHVRPWLLAALAVMLLTGVPLFLSEAVKCYYSTSFRVKATVLPLALLYTFAIREKVARAEEPARPMMQRLVGAGSIALWFVVAAAGRWVGFS